MRVTLRLGLLLFATLASLPSLANAQSAPVITEYPLGQGSVRIALGPANVLWITSNNFGLGPFTLEGGFTSLTIAAVGGMVAGPDSALWYTDTNAHAIGRISPAGVVTTFPLPAASSNPSGIASGPDGALWFTETRGKIGRITTGGDMSEFDVPSALAAPANAPTLLTDITVGPDGALWFTDGGLGTIRKITTAGVVTDIANVGQYNGLSRIVSGPDGALWFFEYYAGKVGRVTTSGVVTEFLLPAGSGPSAICVGPDETLWFTDSGHNSIGQITTDGAITEYPIPDGGKNPQPAGIALGPDGALWFTEGSGSNIGRAAIGSNGPLQIASASLPYAITNVAYSWSLTAIGGAPPYTWSVAPLSVPAGLSVSSDGTISGTPTASGNFSLSATVTDGASAIATAAVGITVYSPTCNYVVTFLGNTPFGPAGGPLGFPVNANPGCTWTVDGMPPWIVQSPFPNVTGGTGKGEVDFMVAPNYTAGDRSATFTVAGVSQTVQQQGGLIPSSGFMPHLAAEGGWRTTFTFVNRGGLPESTQLALTDNSGNPLPLPIDSPQQPSAPPATESSASQTIPGNGLSVVEASGPSNVPFVEGAATMMSTGAVDGFAIFHYDPSGQEAVVPMQNLQSSLAIPFDNTNGVQTGIALQMTSVAGGSYVSIAMRDDSGTQIGTGMEMLTLPANGHSSFVLATQFPVTANKRGTIRFDPPCVPLFDPFGKATGEHCSQMQTLGIRYTPPGTLTTLPALQTVQTTTPGTIAHIASGDGWQTTFVLVNTTGDSYPAILNFYDDNGNPLSLPLTFLATGQTVTASSVTQSITGSLWIQTSGDAGTPLLTGSAQLVSSNPPAVHDFGVLAIFRYNPNGQEAVVPLQIAPTSTSSAYLLAFDNTSNIATGVAISNGSAQAVTVPVTIRDDQGNQIGTSIVSLAANGHTSFMLAAQYPATANIRGTLEFAIPGAGTASAATIGVLGIRSPPQLTFTTLPALPK